MYSEIVNSIYCMLFESKRWCYCNISTGWPVASVWSACRSLVHWTLPLHRVVFFFFLLSLTTNIGFHKFIFDGDIQRQHQSAVAVTSFLFMIDLFQLLLCSLLIVSVLFSRQWLILFFFSVCQTQIFYVGPWFVELLPILSLEQCLENPVQELNFNPCNKTGKCVMFHW